MSTTNAIYVVSYDEVHDGFPEPAYKFFPTAEAADNYISQTFEDWEIAAYGVHSWMLLLRSRPPAGDCPF